MGICNKASHLQLTKLVIQDHICEAFPFNQNHFPPASFISYKATGWICKKTKVMMVTPYYIFSIAVSALYELIST
jgi:hypothetical protein